VEILLENKDLKIRVLEIEAVGFLRQGKYDLAEDKFREQLDLLLSIQKEKDIRIHKGSPFHNLGISLLFQGKSKEAIKNITLAYVEDLISTSTPFETDIMPASSVLRGYCGAIWSDLLPIEKSVIEIKTKKRIDNPEDLLPTLEEFISKIQDNYQKYLQYAWQLEITGQRAITKQAYDEAIEQYSEWVELLFNYQNIREERVHKGHPLFHLGLIYLKKNNFPKAIQYILQSYIEDVITSRKPTHIEATSSYKTLIKLGMGYDLLQNIQEWIYSQKEDEKKLFSPEELVNRFFKEEKAALPKAIPPEKDRAIAEIEDVVTERKSIDNLPGIYSKRVFIGGSYGSDYQGKLRDISQFVKSLGFEPVIMLDYDPPRDSEGKALLNIHDFAVLLVHMCNYAIFELSEAAGQYNEIEWSIRFLRKSTWGVCEQGKKVSTMVTDLFSESGEDIFYYSSSSSMKDHIRSKLCRN
jgi:tetratricopeptide (TPR) repeat protein